MSTAVSKSSKSRDRTSILIKWSSCVEDIRKLESDLAKKKATKLKLENEFKWLGNVKGLLANHKAAAEASTEGPEPKRKKPTPGDEVSPEVRAARVKFYAAKNRVIQSLRAKKIPPTLDIQILMREARDTGLAVPDELYSQMLQANPMAMNEFLEHPSATNAVGGAMEGYEGGTWG